jgi:hypothetical protein
MHIVLYIKYLASTYNVLHWWSCGFGSCAADGTLSVVDMHDIRPKKRVSGCILPQKYGQGGFFICLFSAFYAISWNYAIKS